VIVQFRDSQITQSRNRKITKLRTPGEIARIQVSNPILPVDFAISSELFCAYTGKEGDPTYMKSSDGSSRSREVAEA